MHCKNIFFTNNYANTMSFQKVLNENQNKVFIKFSADWCGPCKTIKPIVDQWIPKFPAEKVHCPSVTSPIVEIK